MATKITIKLRLVLLLTFTVLGISFAHGQTYTFTAAGATGIDGPSQAQVNTAYSGTTLSGDVTVVNGIQHWHVPVGGTYKIEVYGANGYGTYGGRGAYMSGEFYFNPNDELQILVGQQGGCCIGSGTNQYGGGGGTFVVDANNSPLIIAGGGGGANGVSAIPTNANASTSTSGNAGSGTSTSGAGGTSGNGGVGGSNAGSGGGFLTDGSGASAIASGKAFLNGGQGGSAASNGGWGGFGGGGGGDSWDNFRGCGGGGYSGGGGGGSSVSGAEIGGGGGSYNAGTNQNDSVGVGVGDGIVVITLLEQAASVPNNVGVTAFPNFSTGLCSGVQPVSATIRNFGGNHVDSVKVVWEVDGVSQGSNWYQVNIDTFPVLPFDTTITIGTFNFGTPGTTYNIKAWTLLPNNQNDTVNSNDTAEIALTTRISGTYTIDAGSAASATNYQSFGDFIDDLEQFGVCGPVTANVVSGSGPYNEVVSIGDISGASSVNTIRINGNGETVQFTNTTSDRQLLVLDGAKYVTIDSLKFKTLATGYGWGAIITNGAAYDSIMRCEFDLSSVTSTSSANSSGICFSGSMTSATSTGSNGSDCYIGYNYLKGTTSSGGYYYGITVAGASDNNVIEHNVVEDFYYYGIYINGASGTQVLHNDVNRATKTSVTTFYGIYTTGVTPGTHIIGNRVHAPGGTSGGTGSCYVMYLLGDGTATDPVLVANNAIYNINQGGIVYGMYLSTPPYNLVYNNTVNLDQSLSSTSTNYGIYATGTNPGLEIKNNNVSITAGGTGTKYGFYYSTAASIDDAQMNNFYVNSTQSGTQNYGYYASAYATQSAFQTAYPALEVGSPADNPQFANVSTGDFTPQNMALIGQGVNLTAFVPEDINGNPRPATPAIGAFEQPPVGNNNAGAMAIISPDGNFCPGSQTVIATVYNAGVNDITSMQINWSVDGVLQTPISYTDTLVPLTSQTGQSMDTITLGSTTFNSTVPTDIEVWTSLPNGVADPITTNDTVSTSILATAYIATASLDTLCSGGNAVLNLEPNSGYAQGELMWQISSNGSSWTNIPNSDDVSYTDSTLINSFWYRVQIGGSGGCYSDSIKITVLDIDILSTTPGSNCGPGSVTLSATGTPGSTINWYDDALGTNLVDTGSNFNTPSLTTTSTFYASASLGAAGNADSVFVPLSHGTTTGVYNHMFVVHAINGITVDSLGIKCNNSAGTMTSWDVYYRPDNYQNVTGANTSSTGWVLVSSLSNIPSKGSGAYTTISKNMDITIPAGETYSFYIEPASGTTHQYASDGTGTLVASNADAEIIAGNRGSSSFNCTTSGGMATVDIKYHIGGACESTLQPVVATILPTPPTVYLGNDTNFCPGNQTITLDAGHPGNTYTWSTGDNTQSITVTDTGSYTVTVTFPTGCTSSDMIHIISAPFPSVDLPATTDLCDGDTAVLNAGNTGSTYSWSTGDTSQTIKVISGGTYTVDVTNSYGCSLGMNTDVTIRPLPVINLGPDESFCPGDGVTLDAGNPGGQYLWSTGDTVQIIPAIDSGLYTVTVTAGAYNCSNSDTIHLAFNPLPTIGGITSIWNPDSSFTFSAYNVDDFDSTYLWDFGDGHTSTSSSPTHTFDHGGDYIIKLILKNDCGSDTFSIQISFTKTGINQFDLSVAQLKLYPNPAREWVTLENNSAFKMSSVTVYNVLGQVLFQGKVDNPSQYRLDIRKLAAGVYNIKVVMENGSWVQRRFEILK